MADRVLIAISYYYRHISEELLAGATEVLEKAGAKVTVMEVPGAFEIPGVIAMAADSGRFDGAVALGCVIRGETTHYDYVCGESARGLMDLIVQRRQALLGDPLPLHQRHQLPGLPLPHPARPPPRARPGRRSPGRRSRPRPTARRSRSPSRSPRPGPRRRAAPPPAAH